MTADLRSDTFTRPTPAMLEAMMNAQVGDDVFGEDPTVNALEHKAAEMFGMEAAIFCPSGTMTNQIAVKVHTRPGDELIIEGGSHIYYYEGGGIAFNSGCSVALVKGDRGRITHKDVLQRINPDDVHRPVTRLVALENTSNRGGGSIYDFSEIEKISEVCRENELKLHLDGARLFNALAETGQDPRDFGRLFDTISICLSKGLGAPVGSVLIGSREDIRQARRVRKVFGGGMRQAGFIAAAGLFSLENHVERLKEDHRRAQTLAETLETSNYVDEVMPVETNIIFFRLKNEMPAQKFLDHLAGNGIKALTLGEQMVRFVTHLDFTDEMLAKTVNVLKKIE